MEDDGKVRQRRRDAPAAAAAAAAAEESGGGAAGPPEDAARPEASVPWLPGGRWYLALLAARAVLCLAPLSYVHPDEYHQNQEVTSADVLGCDTTLSWEFQPAFPVRSMLFP
jgi:Alg9-like mannosyltransferase family